MVSLYSQYGALSLFEVAREKLFALQLFFHHFRRIETLLTEKEYFNILKRESNPFQGG